MRIVTDMIVVVRLLHLQAHGCMARASDITETMVTTSIVLNVALSSIGNNDVVVKLLLYLEYCFDLGGGMLFKFGSTSRN